MIPLYPCPTLDEALAHLPAAADAADPRVTQAVTETLQAVRTRGDDALAELAQRFGDPAPRRLTAEEIAAACDRLPIDVQALLRRAAENIRAFGEAVRDAIQPVSLDRGEFSVGLRWAPVARVGCYVPGGRYPLPSTALMTAVTAQVAGVQSIAIISPKLPDEVIFAGHLAGVTELIQVGGAQGVAALAYGTETIAPVDMVVGPGNAYVTEAKRQLQGVVGIDMLAGPSEVGIIADETADPDWVALDLLSQAEHDPDARAYLFTPSPRLAEAVQAAIPQHVARLGLPAFVQQSLAGSGLLVLPSLSACAEAINHLAPEHLELLVADPESLWPQLQHYGALFMGVDATVPYGDYLSGPNHTLPTARRARFSGALTPMTFLRPQSHCAVKPGARQLPADTAHFASLEGLTAHASAAECRLPHLGQ